MPSRKADTTREAGRSRARRSLGLWRLVRPYWKLLTLAFVGMLVESAATLWEPWPLKLVFDNVLGDEPIPAWLARWPLIGTSPLALVNAAAVAIVAIAALGAVGSYAQKYLASSVGQRVMYDLRGTLYHHIQRLSLSFFETRRTGDMVVRLTSDIDAAQDFVSSALLGITRDILTLVGMLAIMLYLDWRFALLSLAIAPLLFAVVYRRTRRIKMAAREVKQKESELASIVQESISSIRTVKAFAREDYEERRLAHESLGAMDAALRARSIKAGLPALVDVIIALGTCIVLIVGVRLVLSEQITAGTLLIFVMYLGKMYKPMKDLSKLVDTVSKAAVGFERIAELMNTDSQVANLPGAQKAPPFKGHIELRQVRFGYTPDRLVLKDVDLSVEPGQRAAIVGPTGGGKSTLLALLLRFYDPLSGSVTIDGHDIRSYTLASLRDQISLVPQEPLLFRAPVWQNIGYGKPDATRAEIVQAAILANAHEFIERMPQGYDTILGERGDTISGGQRQRIAIARAVIRRTPILLLDEPSAAMDAESEELVFDALTRLMEGRTSITIAHRMATVRRSQSIFVLDDGVVAARGTHEELLTASPLYARLYSLQFPDRQTPGTVNTAPAQL